MNIGQLHHWCRSRKPIAITKYRRGSQSDYFFKKTVQMAAFFEPTVPAPCVTRRDTNCSFLFMFPANQFPWAWVNTDTLEEPKRWVAVHLSIIEARNLPTLGVVHSGTSSIVSARKFRHYWSNSFTNGMPNEDQAIREPFDNCLKITTNNSSATRC